MSTKDSAEKSKIYVSIGGMSYHLVSGQSEEYIMGIARKADEAVRKVMKNNPSLSNTQAVVLSMVNMLDMLERMSEAYEKNKTELTMSQVTEKTSREDLNQQRNINFELKKEQLRLNDLCKHLEMEIAALRDDETELIPQEDQDFETQDLQKTKKQTTLEDYLDS